MNLCARSSLKEQELERSPKWERDGDKLGGEAGIRVCQREDVSPELMIHYIE